MNKLSLSLLGLVVLGGTIFNGMAAEHPATENIEFKQFVKTMEKDKLYREYVFLQKKKAEIDASNTPMRNVLQTTLQLSGGPACSFLGDLIGQLTPHDLARTVVPPVVTFGCAVVWQKLTADKTAPKLAAIGLRMETIENEWEALKK